MIITYLGHSSFKIRGKLGTIVTDPYNSYVGFEFPTASADIVTVSHDHKDHNDAAAVDGTARRDDPFIVTKPGEYEVENVSVFGTPSYHDDSEGAERGPNTIYRLLVDDISICHLGDLGHELTDEQRGEIGAVDILMIPVGGVFTIGPAKAKKIIQRLDPSIVIPMHYRTPAHDQNVFGELSTLDDFLKEYGAEVEPEKKLKLERSKLPEETELVVLQQG